MTPRQIAAYTFLIARREDREAYRHIHQQLLATGGYKDTDALEKQMAQWQKEIE